MFSRFCSSISASANRSMISHLAKQNLVLTHFHSFNALIYPFLAVVFFGRCLKCSINSKFGVGDFVKTSYGFYFEEIDKMPFCISPMRFASSSYKPFNNIMLNISFGLLGNQISS